MWVHLTLFEAVLTMHRLGGDPLPRAEAERLYAELCRLGLKFGLTEEGLPATVDDFAAYFDRTVAEMLEDNAAVRDLLSGSVYRVPPPGVPIPPMVWAPLRHGLVSLAVEATVATLPPALRRRLGRAPLPGLDLVVRAIHQSSRVVTELLPESWRYLSYAAAAIRTARDAATLESRMDPALFFLTVLDQTGDGQIEWSDLLAMARELSTHLDLDETAENELHAAFESWWQQLREAAGAEEVITFDQYQAAIAARRYPSPPDSTLGVGRVVEAICQILDGNGDGTV